MEKNLHHVFYDRRSWNENPTTRILRNDHRTHIILPVWMHNELHNFCEPLTADARLARIVLERLHVQPRYIDKVDGIKDVVETLYRHEGGEYMAEGIHDQLPFLILGSKALKQTMIA